MLKLKFKFVTKNWIQIYKHYTKTNIAKYMKLQWKKTCETEKKLKHLEKYNRLIKNKNESQ